MLGNIISSIVSAIDPHPLVRHKDLKFGYPIQAFAKQGVLYWRLFRHEGVLEDLSKISSSEIYTSMEKDKYVTWLLINNLYTAIYFIAFIKLTKSPKRLHQELFKDFYDAGVKIALNQDTYERQGSHQSFHTEDDVFRLIQHFKQFGSKVYDSGNEKNVRGISFAVTLLSECIYEAFGISKTYDSYIFEKESLEDALEKMSEETHKHIYSTYSDASE